MTGPVAFEAELVRLLWSNAQRHVGDMSLVLSLQIAGEAPDTRIEIEWQHRQSISGRRYTQTWRIWDHVPDPRFTPEHVADEILEDIWRRAHGD